MSVPTEFDFALIKIGDGADPEVFTMICGMQDVTANQAVQSSDRFVRDCAKPGEVPYRKTRATGKQLDITGSGLSNADTIEDLNDALGVVKNYKIEGYADDGTDAGLLLGTFSGAFRMTSSNLNLPREGDSSSEVNLASHGAWTYTPAS
jgi:hypothetical protein